MTKADLKNKQKVWVYDGNKSKMVGRVTKLANGYTTLTDPRGFVHPMSLLETQYPELNFRVYEKI